MTAYHEIHTNWTEAKSRREILSQLERWNRDQGYNGDVIGAHDFPMNMKVGAVEATLRFELRGQSITVGCSSQPSYRQNLRAIAMAVEAMRLNEKRGIADTLAKAYLQLEAPMEERDPYEVLGVRPDAAETVIDATYKALAKERHSDKGGSDESMKELNEAYERIRSERNGV